MNWWRLVGRLLVVSALDNVGKGIKSWAFEQWMSSRIIKISSLQAVSQRLLAWETHSRSMFNSRCPPIDKVIWWYCGGFQVSVPILHYISKVYLCIRLTLKHLVIVVLVATNSQTTLCHGQDSNPHQESWTFNKGALLRTLYRLSHCNRGIANEVVAIL